MYQKFKGVFLWAEGTMNDTHFLYSNFQNFYSNKIQERKSNNLLPTVV